MTCHHNEHNEHNYVRELELAAEIGQSLLTENQSLKNEIVNLNELLTEAELNAKAACSKAMLVDRQRTLMKKQMVDLEQQVQKLSKQDVAPDVKLQETRAHSTNIKNNPPHNDTSQFDDLAQRCAAAQCHSQDLKKQLVSMQTAYEDAACEVVQLQESVQRHAVREEELASVFVEQSAICKDLQSELEESRKHLEGCSKENEILTQQAERFREIITEKQLQKNALVEQCRQIQTQTTMLLINAGRYDRSENIADELKGAGPQQARDEPTTQGAKKRPRRKSLLEQADEASEKRAGELAAAKQEIQREKRELLQLLVKILQAKGGAGAALTEVSSQIKKETGKGWGGHWGKRHGALLQFLNQHPEMFSAHMKHGVCLCF